MYNALRGYSDVSKLVVPGAITDRMIGFNKSGQTKVWVNENFGMNHPGNHHSDATLDEAILLTNLINAVSPKVDLAPEFLNGVKNSRSFGNALNFIRNNCGVPENVLESNQVNVSTLVEQSQVPVLRDTTPIQNAPSTFVQQIPSTFVQQTPAGYVQQPPVYYQPAVGQQSIQSGYRNQSISFVQPGVSSSFVPAGSFQSGYKVPRYADSVGTNKFSFTGAQ